MLYLQIQGVLFFLDSLSMGMFLQGSSKGSDWNPLLPKHPNLDQTRQGLQLTIHRTCGTGDVSKKTEIDTDSIWDIT